MKTSRFSRFLTVIVAILSLLYMQFAVASYVCPGQPMKGGRGMSLTGAMAVDMPNCQGMDVEQPALCHFYGHDAASKHSLDKTPMPDVQPFVAAALVLNLQFSDVAAVSASISGSQAELTRVTSPPIAIRHCCFRI